MHCRHGIGCMSDSAWRGRPSTEIAQTIYGSIQELAGFDRPEWLDMPP